MADKKAAPGKSPVELAVEGEDDLTAAHLRKHIDGSASPDPNHKVTDDERELHEQSEHAHAIKYHDGNAAAARAAVGSKGDEHYGETDKERDKRLKAASEPTAVVDERAEAEKKAARK